MSGDLPEDLHSLAAEFGADREKRRERLAWLEQNGDREVLLRELVLFSRRIDALALQILAREKVAEASHLRSMSAGRRQCQRCRTCRKYIPGLCLSCGCPPLMHEKVPFARLQQEAQQCEEELRHRQRPQRAGKQRSRGQPVRFTEGPEGPGPGAEASGQTGTVLER